MHVLSYRIKTTFSILYTAPRATKRITLRFSYALITVNLPHSPLLILFPTRLQRKHGKSSSTENASSLSSLGRTTSERRRRSRSR
jgi:hypothetical protein